MSQSSESEQGAVPGQQGAVTDEVLAALRSLLAGDPGPWGEFERRYRGTGNVRVERALDLLWKATFEIFLHHRLGPEPSRQAVIEHVAEYRKGMPRGDDPGAVVPEKIIRGFYGDAQALHSLSPDQLANLGSMLMHLVVVTDPSPEQLDDLLVRARARAEELAAYQASHSHPGQPAKPSD